MTHFSAVGPFLIRGHIRGFSSNRENRTSDRVRRRTVRNLRIKGKLRIIHIQNARFVNQFSIS